MEAAADAIKRLREMTGLDEKLAAQVEQAELTLAKKAESKPIMPEEYTNLSKLVDAYEKTQAQGKQSVRAEKAQQVAAIKETINKAAYKVKLRESGLPDRAVNILLDAEYETVGAVMEQMAIDENRILALDGIGPKVMDELKTALAAMQFPEPELAPEPTAEAGPVAEAAVSTMEAAAVSAEAALVEGAPVPEGTAETPAAVEGEGEPVKGLIGDEEEEDDPSKPGKKKAKKKDKGTTREVTFNEELGVLVATKKRKPGRLKDWEVLDE